MTSKRGRDLSRLMTPRSAPYMNAATGGTTPTAPAPESERETIVRVPLSSVRPSPFQPAGRPSASAVEAVRSAITDAGGLAALMDEPGADVFGRLGDEARALAALAADVEAHGIEAPLEVRQVAGGLELLSGHRRLAAAQLAALAEVPVQDRGALPDHEAAAVVFRRNRLREDFTPWQEAVSLAELRRRRREASEGSGSVRDLARVMGYSVGRAGELLQIAEAFPRKALVAIGGSADAGGEVLSALPYKALRRVLAEPADARVHAVRRLAGLPDDDATRSTVERSSAPTGRAPAYTMQPRRAGGFTFSLFKTPADLTAAEARRALDELEPIVRDLRRSAKT
jgi:ParB family chromosome partitioning protein